MGLSGTNYNPSGGGGGGGGGDRIPISPIRADGLQGISTLRRLNLLIFLPKDWDDRQNFSHAFDSKQNRISNLSSLVQWLERSTTISLSYTDT